MLPVSCWERTPKGSTANRTVNQIVKKIAAAKGIEKGMMDLGFPRSDGRLELNWRPIVPPSNATYQRPTLTFDDGYRDNYEIAYPILKKFDVPFTIFVTTGLIDRTRTLPTWWHVLEDVIDRNVFIEYKGVTLASSTKRAKAVAYRLISEYFRHLDQRNVISATDASSRRMTRD